MISNETIERVIQFTKDRDWDQFHSPSNLAKAIAIEGSELLECFLWDNENYDMGKVREELADVLNYCIQMADVLHLDMDEIINTKMEQNAAKYPVEKAKGSAKKYTEL